MYQDKIVLCVSNAYKKKFYLNEDFNSLPEQIRQELQIMCVLFTEDVTEADEGDILYDDIGSALKIKEIQRTKKEFLEALEMYYKVFFLGEDASNLL